MIGAILKFVLEVIEHVLIGIVLLPVVAFVLPDIVFEKLLGLLQARFTFQEKNIWEERKVF